MKASCLALELCSPEWRRDAAGRSALLLDGEEERVLAILSAAYGRSIPASVINKLRKAADLWSRGERALAQIHLSQASLPSLNGEDQAFRLFAANEVVERGLSPRKLMTALGLDPAPLDLLKNYNPDQPRVPAGSGREGGRWTSGDAGGASLPPETLLSHGQTLTGIPVDFPGPTQQYA
jgi:hypothetical protein